jgi:hypothetical protein
VLEAAEFREHRAQAAFLAVQAQFWQRHASDQVSTDSSCGNSDGTGLRPRFLCFKLNFNSDMFRARPHALQAVSAEFKREFSKPHASRQVWSKHL